MLAITMYIDIKTYPFLSFFLSINAQIYDAAIKIVHTYMHARWSI
jgi:hypothetical protein